MALKPGKPQDYSGSMTEKIEEAFERAWNETHETDLPDTNEEERRVLFVAIAQGVIGYLQEHADDGFEVVADAEQKDGNNITSEGTIDIPGVGQAVSVSVEQTSDGDNRVQSRIEGTAGKIHINAEELYG